MGFFFLSEVDRCDTVSLRFADDFEEGYRNQPPSGRDKGIARFVPVQVVLSADNVEEISLAEAQFLRVAWFGLVVVKRLYYLYASRGDGQHEPVERRG